MGKYKVIDYAENERRSAEEVRMLLRFLGEEFEDVRIPKDGAKSAEEAAPFGCLPVLEENGNVVAIHSNMSRYVAHRHDIAGKTIEEKIQCGIILEGLRQFLLPLYFTVAKKTGDERQAVVLEHFKEHGGAFFGYLEKHLKKHEDREYFVSNQISWCDLSMGAFLQRILSKHPAALDQYPSIKSFAEKMSQVPAIKGDN